MTSLGLHWQYVIFSFLFFFSFYYLLLTPFLYRYLLKLLQQLPITLHPTRQHDDDDVWTRRYSMVFIYFHFVSFKLLLITDTFFKVFTKLLQQLPTTLHLTRQHDNTTTTTRGQEGTMRLQPTRRHDDEVLTRRYNRRRWATTMDNTIILHGMFLYIVSLSNSYSLNVMSLFF
jgi:hypothetical protein